MHVQYTLENCIIVPNFLRYSLRYIYKIHQLHICLIVSLKIDPLKLYIFTTSKYLVLKKIYENFSKEAQEKFNVCITVNNYGFLKRGVIYVFDSETE